MSAGVSVQHYNTFPPPLDRTSAVLAERRAVDPMPYLTQQYALPIHRPGPYRHHSDSALASTGLHPPPLETSLRRKTPNGTLSAGFDASLDASNPPHKHQLLNGSHAFTPREHVPDGNGASFLGPSNLTWQSGPLPQAQSVIPVMDSLTNQNTPNYFTTQPYYGRSIPSVIQPSFQYIGPTASGGQGAGPYGPYWHDGTYVPYRPAATRDPRFYHHVAGNNLTTGMPGAPMVYSPVNSWQQPTHPPQAWTPHGGPTPHHSPSLAFPGPPIQAAPRFEHASTGATPLIRTRDVVPGHPSQLAQSSSSAAKAIDAEFGPSSSNGRNRDEVFSWALQQYRELLAFIQHTRQSQQHSRTPHGQPHVPQRPSFLPKPPRPTASGSSVRSVHKKVRTDASRGNDIDQAPSYPWLPDPGTPLPRDRNAAEPAKPRAGSVWTPGASDPFDYGFNRRASYDQYQSALHHPRPSASVPFEGRPRAMRHLSGPIAHTTMRAPQLESPLSRAVSALASITELCQESGWEWTDGMHLGGCLAYGLENYSKALRWFTMVLEHDHKHLEATSNLAATMLALGQRKEAEKNWTKVVKAAPNHFEAVEHLVGLLCNEQRSKDAIRVIEDMERALRLPRSNNALKGSDRHSECSSSTASGSPSIPDSTDKIAYDFEPDGDAFTMDCKETTLATEPGFGSSGFAIPGCDNGRILALIHAKGNMLYGIGDNAGAAKAFEDAVLIAVGRKYRGIQGLVEHILTRVSNAVQPRRPQTKIPDSQSTEPILLTPADALQTALWCFPYSGDLPGLYFISGGTQSLARKAVISTTSNALLSLAKIFQDGMANASRSVGVTPLAHGVRDILALYYLSLALQPSPSTANNVGILLASVQQTTPPAPASQQRTDIPGVVPGSGIALALQYYNYGLQLDQHHAHLYTNLGSLLKDIGQLDAAINMYERAVKCDGKFDIALANLANAVKDKGRISDAIVYYRRAVEVSPDFAEAVCGLANALNSVCSWQGRGGISDDAGRRDRWHVDSKGMLFDGKLAGTSRSGWIKRVVDIVDKQLAEGENWGVGTLSPALVDSIIRRITAHEAPNGGERTSVSDLRQKLTAWSGQSWEGARVTRLIERATRRIAWQRYRDMYVDEKERPLVCYQRPQLPSTLAVPTAPTVLPFHTFTCPMSAKQIRLISQRNGLRISVSTLRSPWLPQHVYRPPPPPSPHLRVGYVSSDFNNHPLAHLMQSVFGLHDRGRVKAYCYATTASDNSIHRQQIQAEAPVFHDASAWSAERLVHQIIQDGIHILVNLNGYTRGARNEVFAARPAPIQMSFMGFAGTLGAEWCDYLLADATAVPPDTLRPYRRNVTIADQMADDNNRSGSGGGSSSGGDGGEHADDWVYGENIIYCRDTFFCCDHKQSAPDASDGPDATSWAEEQRRRWRMRKELFPDLADDTVIFGNFNQLYKIEPTTFRTWLRILARVPNAILWLLRFPDPGEAHLLATARLWAGAAVAARIRFTDVAPKQLHIARARLCDLVLDTAECNAHTTAADVLWSGTPLLTLPRYPYKMCSRMAASILRGALPRDPALAARADAELVAVSEEDYEEKAVRLGKSLVYQPVPAPASDPSERASSVAEIRAGDVDEDGSAAAAAAAAAAPAAEEGVRIATGRLADLRQLLFHARWSSALFDTHRWVADLEDAYDEAWRRWVAGEGGDIWLDQIPKGRRREG